MKRFFYCLKWIVGGVLGLIVVVFLLLAFDRDAKTTGLTEAERANIVVRKEYSQAEDEARFDELMAEFGNKKSLAPGFELQCLLALSHFPELKDTDNVSDFRILSH